MHLGVSWFIEGLEHIPTEGGVILASNHISYLDPLALGYFATKRGRRTRFLTKEELFAKPVIGPLFASIGHIPVRRGTVGAANSLVEAEAALRVGRCIAVFPEGTISLDLEPMVGKTGTARLAAATGVPVVPIGLWGLQRIMFKGRKPRWRPGIAEVVKIGPPISIAPDEDAAVATDRIMAAICDQVQRARAAYPQASGTGEGDWWIRPPETAVLKSCQ